MKQQQTTVTKNVPIAKDTYRITVKLPHFPKILPGQFLNVKVPNEKFLLRRPFAICSHDEKNGTVDFGCFVKGGGTQELVKIKKGDLLDILLPLGNSFPLEYKNKKVMIIGGGIGVFPMLSVVAAFPNSYAFIGFRSKENAVLIDDFKRHAKELFICSDDGSLGEHGYCTNIARREYDRIKPDVIFACGPHGMFGALRKIFADTRAPIYVSLEQRMACGFGTCICCNQLVEKNGVQENARVCCEGPVFKLEEVIL